MTGEDSTVVAAQAFHPNVCNSTAMRSLTLHTTAKDIFERKLPIRASRVLHVDSVEDCVVLSCFGPEKSAFRVRLLVTPSVDTRAYLAWYVQRIIKERWSREAQKRGWGRQATLDLYRQANNLFVLVDKGMAEAAAHPIVCATSAGEYGSTSILAPVKSVSFSLPTAPARRLGPMDAYPRPTCIFICRSWLAPRPHGKIGAGAATVCLFGTHWLALDDSSAAQAISCMVSRICLAVLATRPAPKGVVFEVPAFDFTKDAFAQAGFQAASPEHMLYASIGLGRTPLYYYVPDVTLCAVPACAAGVCQHVS
jgi:hypothetical protein